MPQLMPLMWINSVMISIIILLTLVDIYYYKEYNCFNNLDTSLMLSSNNFKW